MKNYTNRIGLNVIGTMITAFGISVAMRAGFGDGSIAVLWQGLVNQLPITVGAASMLVSLVMIALVLMLDRKQLHVGTVVHLVAYSIFLDIFGLLDFRTNNAATDFCIMIVASIIFSIGIGIYASANTGRGPYESLCFAIHQKKGWKFRNVRMILDALLVVTGLLMGGKIGLCTVTVLLINGPVIQLTCEWLARVPWYNRTFAHDSEQA